jgi:methionine-rich copper-binding protein CopC
MKKIFLLFSVLLISFSTVWSQVTVFSDDINGTDKITRWTTASTGGNPWTYNALGRNATLPGSIACFTHPSENNDSWIFSEGISMTAGVTYTLTFYQRRNGSATLEVKLGTEASAAGMTISPTGSSTFTSTSWATKTVTFEAPTTATHYLGFHCTTPYVANSPHTPETITENTVYQSYYMAIDEIKVTRPPALDAAVLSIDAPVSGKNLPADATVTITVKNNGLQTIDILPVKFDLTTGGNTTVGYGSGNVTNLAAGATTNHTFSQTVDLSQSGDYTIKAYTELAGDEVPTNDSKETTVNNMLCPATAIPPTWSEGFEGLAAGTLPTECWSASNITINPATNFQTAAARTGSGFFYVRYSTTANMTTPYFSFTADKTYRFSFWYSTDVSNANNPSHNIYAELHKASDGSLVQTIGTPVTGIATANQYLEYSGQFTPATSEDYYIYLYVKVNVDPWFISFDDLKIEEVVAAVPDAGVTAITSPAARGVRLSQQTVSVTVKNYGSTELPAATPVAYKLNDGAEVVETIGSAIAIDGTLNVDFATKADNFIEGDNVIQAYTKLADDNDVTNDTVTLVVKNFLCAPVETLTEEFNNVVSEELSPCWVWDVYRGWESGRSGNGWRLANKGDYLITPELAPTAKDKSLSYYMYNGVDGQWEVGYSNTADTAGVTTWNKVQADQAQQWKLYGLNIDKDAKFVIFRNIDQRNILDDINIASGLTVTGSDPAMDATVDINTTEIKVTFSENITLLDYTVITLVDSLGNAVKLSASAANNVLTIMLEGSLSYDMKYTLTIPVGTIRDFVAGYLLTFTVKSEIPLVIKNKTPQGDKVAGDAKVSVTFDRAVEGTINSDGVKIYLTDDPGTEVSATIEGGALQLTIDPADPNTVMIIEHENFGYYKREHTVLIPAGCIPGYYEDIEWTFTTAVRPIHISKVNPEDGATGVPVEIGPKTDGGIEITFDVQGNALRDANPDFTKFKMKDGDGNELKLNVTQKRTTGRPAQNLPTIRLVNDPEYPEPGDLKYSTTYTIIIEEGAVEGLELPEGQENFPITYTFTTEVKPELAVVTTMPGNGDNDVTIDCDVNITFNRALDEVELINPTGVKIYRTDDPDWTVSNKDGGELELVYEPGSNFKKLMIEHGELNNNINYTVLIPAGSIAGIDTIKWSFTTMPGEMYMVSTVPAEDATNVYPTDEVRVTLNRPVNFNSSTFQWDLVTIKDSKNELLTGIRASKPIGPSSYFTIAHDPFAYNETYTVSVPKEVIVGLMEDIEWSFTTASGPKTIKVDEQKTTPAKNATGVALDKIIEIFFDETPDFNGAINFTKFTVKDDTGAAVDVTVTLIKPNLFNPDTKITISHEAPFAYSTKYTVTIEEGAIVGLNGGSYSYSFTTENQPIAVVSVTPEDKATGVAVGATVSVTFDLPIATNGAPKLDGTNITIVNGKGSPLGIVSRTVSEDGKTITIGHGDFNYETEYTITVKKETVIGLAENVVWTFTTEGKPVAINKVSVTPEDGATEVAVDAAVSVTFDLPVNIYGTPDWSGVSIKDKDNTTFTVAEVTVSEDGKTVTVVHSDFAFDTEYTVSVPKEAVTGLTGAVVWKFTTKKGVGMQTVSEGKVYASHGRLYVTGYPAGTVVEIYNITGQWISSYKVTTDTPYVTLKAGVYIVRVQSEGKMSVHKVLVD